MLPFGLTTDVSAAALTAGAGGVPASGPVANTKASGFANELKTVAGQGAAPLAEGPGTGAPVAGVAGQAPAASPRLQIHGIAVAVERAADVAVPRLPTELPVPPSGALTKVKFEGLDRASIKSVEVPGPEVAEELSELLAEPLADPLTDPLADVPVEAALVAAASVPAAPVPAVVAVSGEGEGEAITLVAGQSAAGGAVPGTPPLPGAAVPAPLPGQVPEAAPLPVDTGSEGVTDAAPELDGQDTAEAGLPTRVAGEQAAAAETARQVPVTKDRRWQTELPQELRAQTHVPVRAAVATAPATGQPAAEVALLPNGKTLPAQASERAVQVIAAVMPGSARAKPAEPALQQPVQGAVTEPALQGQTAAPTAPAVDAQQVELLAGGQAAEVAGSEKTGPNTAAPVISQSATGAAAAQPPAELAGQFRSVAQAPADALPAPVLADDQLSAGSSAEADNGTLTTGLKTGAAQADQSALQRIGAGNSDEAQVAGARPVTLASAAPAFMAAAEVSQEDADLSLIKTEPGPVGEIGSATVRGGDLSGAARTESLQTPNQTQSAHVATQVAAEVARNLKSGQTRFQMRFDPPELGRVEVHMKVNSDGSVQTHLIVERPETLDMFLRDQRGLERALENAGLKPDSENMQFSLKQDGNRDFASGRDQSGGQAPEQGSIGSGGSEDADPVLEEVVRLTLARQRGGLDMKV